ncbi:MAG: DNA polymerase III subunit delta [Candidatus Falkowbacteria bacterium]
MIFFFYGPDDYRAKHKIRELKEKFRHDVDLTGSGLVELSGDKWSFADWHDMTAADSLFARRRLVVVNGLFKRDKALLEQMLETLADSTDNILIIYEPALVYNAKKDKFFILDSEEKEKALTIVQEKLKTILAKAEYQQFYERLSGNNLNAWIANRFSDLGVSVSTQAVQLLAAQSGGDLWPLVNEIDRIAAFAKGGGLGVDQTLGSPEIKELTNASLDENIFTLMDAISNRNKPAALGLIEEQLAGGAAEAYLITMLARQFKILAQARACLDEGLDQRAVASEIKLHPFAAQKAINQARSFNRETLARIIKQLVEIDRQYKTGAKDFRLLVDRLIIEM